MDTIIPVNRKIFPVPLFISICVALAICAFLFFTKSFTINPYSPASLLVIVLFMNVRVIIVFARAYKRIRFDKNMGLTISDTGVFDNLTKFSLGQIAWQDIDAIAIDKYRNTNILLIGLKNNDKYAVRVMPQRMKIFRSYIAKWNTPLVISAKWIDYKLEDLRDLLITRSSSEINSYDLRDQ